MDRITVLEVFNPQFIRRLGVVLVGESGAEVR